MRATWDRIRTWCEANAPEIVRTLLPPASDAAIKTVEQTIDATFPDEHRASLRIHEGQKRGAPGIVTGWRLSGLADSMRAWKRMSDRLASGEIDVETDEGVRTRGPVKPVWWSARWIPVASDDAGNYLCVDLDPASDGTNGQVIHFYHDFDERCVMAESFGAWLRRFADDLDAGCIEADRGEAGLFIGVRRRR
jgi:cell wall assembly regulator SMI1